MSESKKKEQASDGNKNDPYCTMCSNNDCSIYHEHWSTVDQRMTAICSSDQNEFSCPVCHATEPALTVVTGARRILLADETCYKIWEHETVTNQEDHFEMECAVSARVRHLHQTVKSNFLYQQHRLEIIVIGGIHNVGDGDPAEKVIAEFAELKETILRHSLINRHNPPSSVSIATLILPPKYCSYHVPKDVPSLENWLPGSNFDNKRKTIEQINAAIKNFNQEDKLEYVGLHMQGLKFFKSGTIQHKFDTRDGAKKIWEENEVFKKLHFTMEIKLKIISYVIGCFRANAVSRK